jgi:hypothetical protein
MTTNTPETQPVAPPPARLTHAPTWLPLALVLLVQAIVSLFTLHNTAFIDEATYIYAGGQLLQHKATIGQYATYFSGYPNFYPAIAGALNQIGGLEFVRLFSTICMLVVTVCAFLVTNRLFDRGSAYCAATLFAFTGPVLFLSRLATFDALALVMLALAATLAVTVPSLSVQAATFIAPTIGLLLLLAITAKYVALLFMPFVIALLALHAHERQGRPRAIFYTGLAIAGGAVILWFASGLITSDVLRGIGYTTTARAALIPAPTSKLLTTILQAGLVIWLLSLVGLVVVSLRQKLVAIPLLVASLAAPLYHLHSGESTSLYKHMAFAMLFAVPLAGVGLAAAIRHITALWYSLNAIQVTSAIVCLILLALAMQSAGARYNTGWSDTTQLAATMAPLLSNRPVRCLCEDTKVLQYELAATTEAWQYTDPYYFHYQAHGKSLVGDAAYIAAIKDGYFDVVELNFSNPVAHIAVDAMNSGKQLYHLVAKMPQSVGANAYFIVWTKIDTTPRTQVSGQPITLLDRRIES